MNRDSPKAEPQDSRLVAKGAFINIAGYAIGVLDWLFPMLIARVLGSDTLGSFVLTTTTVQLLFRLGVMGLDKGMLRHVPHAMEEEASEAALHSVLGTALRRVATISILAMVVVLVAAPQVAALLGGGEAGRDGWWLRWMILALPAEAMRQLLLFALRGRNDMVSHVVVQNVLAPTTLFAVAIPLILLGLGDLALIIAYVTQAYVGLTVASVLFVRRFPGIAVRRMWAAPRDRRLLRFSNPQGLTELLNYGLARLDVIMLGAFFPGNPEYVGFYFMAAQMAGSVKKVRQAFDTSISPVIAGLLFRGERREALTVFRDVARWVHLLFMGMGGILTLAAPAVLLGFGQEYAAYWYVVPIMVAGRFFNSVGGPTQATLLMAGHSRLELINNVSISLLNMALNALLIPRYGVNGAALATALALTVFNLVRVYELWHFERLIPRAFDVLRISLAGLLALAGPLAGFLWFDWGPLASIVSALVYIPLYVAMLRLFGMHHDLKAAFALLRTPKSKRAAVVETAGDELDGSGQ